MIREDKSGGRAVTGEELDRIVSVVPKVLFRERMDGKANPVDQSVVESWQHLLCGLFWSGLRIGEAHLLTWDDDTLPAVNLVDDNPTMWIPGRFQKNGKDKFCTIVPEFFDFLQKTPESQRTGIVFNPVSPKIDTRPTLDTFKRKISAFGREARVKVKDLTSGNVKCATAHDLRRSFGLRWSLRVVPGVLKELMRHPDD